MKQDTQLVKREGWEVKMRSACQANQAVNEEAGSRGRGDEGLFGCCCVVGGEIRGRVQQG